MCQMLVPEHRYPCSSSASSQVLSSVLGQSANPERRGRVSHAAHRFAVSKLSWTCLYMLGVISENFLMRMLYSREDIVKSIQNNFYAIRVKIYSYKFYY